MRSLRRDPGHLPELIVLHAQRSLARGAKEWAERAVGDESRSALRAGRAARAAARMDGLASGTPFLIALVPGYVAALWEQARLALRLAAMSGRDPASMETAAELLVLRNVHPDATTALSALREAAAGERESLGKGVRGRASVLWELGRRILLFAAFLDAPEHERSVFFQVLSFIAAGLVWILTCIFPLTFMALMAWSCETATRRLDAAARDAWLPELPDPGRESPAQFGRRVAALALVTGLPVLILVHGVTTGNMLVTGVAGVSGLAMALMLSILVSRQT
ncbi:MAG: hypothetical protein F2799_01230 [Actinobacteria bacterium]|uniref:Unannotated protein n=1 Tax=freshwater metagenome TaxID=449393 RepID=A0A6J7CZI5_9ZZZZ|nr:hypothetical protein [Actinomycetota bacterium]